jgi:hypothetical protein
LYVVYEGTNPDTGQPIIKAFLNPLVGWIWAGLVVMVFGTLVALVPSLSPATPLARARGASVPIEPAEGRRLMKSLLPHDFTFWMRACKRLALAVAVCFSLGATDAGSRFNDLGHRLMCTCGCAQLLGECNHVGCPSRAELKN